MNATLVFLRRTQAEEFAKAWSRQTLKGHVISSGEINVKVCVYGVTDAEKQWISEYIQSANN